MLDRVLITGASSGIGKEAAQAFAEKGSSLFLVARRADRLEEVAEICRQKGSPRVVCASHDLAVAGQGAVVVRECLEQLGGLDVLVCNAGYGVFGPVHKVDPKDMARIWQVNYQSGFESIHEALPYFLERRQGHIVLTSSVIGKVSIPLGSAYCATKFAQIALGESLWGELRGTGVGVSVVCPGFTATEFQQASERTQGTQKPERSVKGQHPRAVADAMVEAVLKKKREVHLTFPGKVLMAVNRISPSLAVWVMATLSDRERRQRAQSKASG